MSAPSKTKTVSVAVLVALGLTLTTWAAEPLPYGHKDFVPTPEQPVYFRQTHGNYPGATPPLEWWEGTPTTKKVKVGDSKSSRDVAVPDFADQKSKNILWKVPAGGWSLSHPIVVGTKVFSVGVPDVITCNDLATGKQLWQKRAMPLLMDGVPEEKAAAVQKVFDLVRALWLIGHADHGANPDAIGLGGGNNAPEDGKFLKGTLEGEDLKRLLARKRESVAKVIRMVQAHRGEVVAVGEADLVTALDADLAVLEAMGKMDDAALAKELATRKNYGDRLRTACMKKYQVPFTTEWSGNVGVADSTLASDGRCIYGTFDQGQVFCYDLDGNLKWGMREKGEWDPRGSFLRSPLLYGDLVLVRSAIRDRRRGDQPLRAFDAATGKNRWETPLTRISHAMPCLMRLPGADGKPVDVLVSNMAEGKKDKGQAVLRMTDGKILGYLPSQLIARGPLMAVFGQQVTWVEDTGPACSYRLRLDDAGAVVAEEVFVKEGFHNHNLPTVTGTTMLNNNRLFDATTGEVISKLPVKVGDLGVVAGHYLITLATEGGWHGDINNNPKNRARDDRMTFGVFMVIDIKDPAKPVVVAKNNLLGYKEPAADIIVSTYLKEFDPYGFAGVYKGTASYFAMMGGPVPVGNRLLIQTSAFLYCIGEK